MASLWLSCFFWDVQEAVDCQFCIIIYEEVLEKAHVPETGWLSKSHQLVGM